MKNSFFTAICCMTMLAGCQQAEEIINPSEELPMAIEASIENTTESRYASSNNTPNNLSFATDESIGIFVNERPAVKWTNKGENSWESETTVYWPDKSEEGHHFYAYYPYTTATSKENVPMPSLANQTGSIESLSACDFMVATTNKKYTDNNGIVSFTGETDCFKHVSSLVAITILKESDLEESTITKISLEGEDTNLGSSTTYSFETKVVTVTTISNKMESADLEVAMANEQTNKTLYFIVNSGANLSDVTFSIEYTTDGENYIASKSGLGSANLTKGNRYNFNLNITDGVLNISGNEIEGWGEGTNMDDIIINTPTTQSTPNP